MRRLQLALLACCLPAFATNAYVRTGGPTVAYIIGASVGPPAELTTMFDHQFTAGMTISCWSIAGMTNLNGYFLVNQGYVQLDHRHFSVNNLSGTPITGNAAWTNGGQSGGAGGIQYCQAVTSTALASGLRGLFDGSSGTYSRNFFCTTSNGCTSLTVDSSHVAHVTAPSGYISTGGKVAIWNSGSTALDNSNAPYTVTADTATTFHFTVSSSVAAGTYSNSNNTCGPLSSADCLVISQWAHTSNPFWVAAATESVAYNGVRHLYDGGTYFQLCNATQAEPITAISLKLLVDRADTSAAASLVYWVTHVQRFCGVAYPALESQSQGGQHNFIDDLSGVLLKDVSLMFSVANYLGYLTSQQQSDFAGIMLNGWSIQDLPNYTKNLVVQLAGTATFDGTHWNGTGTNWSTSINACDSYGCDAVYSSWSGNPGQEYYVNGTITDTQITVLTAYTTPIGTATTLYVVHHWVPGLTGAVWLNGYSSGQPQYWPNGTGGGGANWSATVCCVLLSQNAYATVTGFLAVGSVLADLDSRAVDLFSTAQSLWWDAGLVDVLGYNTGFGSSGTIYTTEEDVPFRWWSTAIATRSLPSVSLPTVALAAQQTALYKTFEILPNLYSGFTWPACWGNCNGSYWLEATALNTVNYETDPSFILAPTSTAATSFLNYVSGQTWYSNGAHNYGALPALWNNPSIVGASYTALPLQYFFTPVDVSGVQTLTGTQIPVSSGFAADAVVSRTGWSYPTAETHLEFLSVGSKGSDYFGIKPSAGDLHISKQQMLIGTDDQAMLPAQTLSPDDPQQTTNIINFVGMALHAQTNWDFAVTPMLRWRGSTQFGDTSNKVVYAMSETVGQYAATLSIPGAAPGRAQISVVHFKANPGTNDEFVISYIDVDQSTATTKIPFAHHIQYQQNGESAYTGFYDAEGNTTCPDTGGCSSLNTTRHILSQQSGTGSNIYGIVSRFLSPTNIFAQDDGSSFSGGYGHTHRVSIYGGTSNTDTPASADWIECHKIAQNMSDTILTCTAINPDANWTGVQASGANTSAVALFARAGVTHASMAGFTTTHSGTAQYLFGGLTPGTYSVTVGGTAVSGSPFTVASGDTSLYFESTAGAVSLSNSSPVCSITTTTLPGGTVGTPYSQTISTVNCTPNPPTSNWTVASGTLCAGLSLSPSTGTISGTPTTAQTCSFTIQVIDSIPNTAVSGPLSITISASAVPAAALGGAAKASGAAVIHER